MSELKADHTLHAEHMLTMFGGSTYQLKCSCGETKAVLTIWWGEGVLHITAIEDDHTVQINRFGPPTRWQSS